MAKASTMFWRLGGSLLAVILVLGGIIAVTAVIIFLYKMHILSPGLAAAIVAAPILGALSLYTFVVQSARKRRVRRLKLDPRYKRALKILYQAPMGEEFQQALQYLESKGIDRQEARENLRVLRKFQETGTVD
jgi:hypothetical protein